MSPFDGTKMKLTAPKQRPLFVGFPDRFAYAALPQPFFHVLLPQIRELAELKVTLYLLWLLLGKRGFPRCVTAAELEGNPSLLKGLASDEEPPEEALHRGLELAVQRGTFLRLAVEREGKPGAVYLLNTPQGRQALEKLARGELSLPDSLQPLPPVGPEPERPSIFALYEENIGLLTPLIVEELKEAAQRYAPTWVEEAFRLALAHNKRNWRYIARILERWATEGKDDGETRRHSGALNTEKYFRDPYGRPFKR